MNTNSDNLSLERGPRETEGASPDTAMARDLPASVHEEGSTPPPTAEHVTPTRMSASWTAVVAAVALLIVLVIFIGENTQRSTVNFVGFHGHAPTAVALLIAALAGAVIVVIVGAARILQLRKVARHSESISPGKS